MTLLFRIYILLKRKMFQSASDKNYKGKPKLNQPTLIKLHPKAKLEFAENVKLGWPQAVYYYSGYINIKIAGADGAITIGKNTTINNNAHFYCDSSSITIGDDCLIGPGFFCMASDGHDINPEARRTGVVKGAPITIMDNVFIGGGVTVLKGVEIGKNSVIAAGSVVTKSFPENSIIGGNPAKLIKEIE